MPATASTRIPTGASVGIPPRHMRFARSDATERYWSFDGNGLTTMMFAVFSGIFPEGERYFVESVRHFRKAVDDPELQARIAGFIGQEALHGREHDRLNEWFAERGVAIDIPEAQIRWSMKHLRRLPPRLQLACTTMMEHFTAHLAKRWLTDQRFRSTSDAEMLKLWSWHALEELEHKAVAYEVFEAIGGTRRERQMALAIIAVFLAPAIIGSWLRLLRREGLLTHWRENARGLRALFGKKGFLTPVINRVPVYLRPDFHPSRHDTSALEAEWRERLFGVGGELNEEWGNREALSAA